MSRLIEQVYEQIIVKIPKEKVKLREDLKKFIAGLWNKAPEVRTGPEVYLPFANILAQHIDPHACNLTEWEKQVVDIFNGEANDEFVEDMDDFDYAHHTMAHY